MNKDLDDTLKTIAANANAMREAGVIGRVVANGVEFELAPDAAPVVAKQLPEVVVSPLDDETTFGTDGVPQRRKPTNHAAARSEFEKE